MRLCLVLALVVVALVVLTIKAGRRSPRHAAATPEIAEVVGQAASDAPAPSGPAISERPETSGIAHLRGRVVFPAGSEPPEDVAVVADSGTRTFDAHVLDDGRFEMHLPAGRYTLVASADELVGTIPDFLLSGGAEREVDIRLAVGATIRGRLRLPAGKIDPAEVEINAAAPGRDDDNGVFSVDGDTFAIEGLLPGRRYDLRFQGPGVRTVTMSGVTAPSQGLVVELQARARITGAIGFARGAPCPIDEAKLIIAGSESDDEDAAATVGDDCTFTLTVPDQAAEVTVVAKGKGWFLEQRVAVPALGDPGPICLNPPCRSHPEEDLARLRLTLDGASEGSYIEATANPTGRTTESAGYHSCFGAEGRCDIAGLWAGQTFSIGASGDKCRGDAVPVTLVAGDNHVRILCHRQREIEGVIRVPEDQAPDYVTVRCAGDNWKTLVKTRLFRLTCESDAAALEYRIGTEGPLRSVPIASLAGSSPAFVDIGY